MILKCALIVCVLATLLGCESEYRTDGGGITYTNTVTKTPVAAAAMPQPPKPPKETGNPDVDGPLVDKYRNDLDKFLEDMKTWQEKPEPQTTETTSVTVHQPQNAKEPANFSIQSDKNGKPMVTSGTGGSHNPAEISGVVAKAKLLNIPMIVGGILVLAGALAIAFGKQLKSGLMLIGVGFATFMVAWLLAEYAVIFLLLAILILAGWIVYTMWKHGLLRRATVENTALIQNIKKDMTEEDKVHYFKDEDSVANGIQSQSTKDIVAEIKEKEL